MLGTGSQSCSAERRPGAGCGNEASGIASYAQLPRDEVVKRRLIESRRDFMRFFRLRLSRSEDAEDAFQDFCMKAIRAAGGVEDVVRIDAWLGRILHNTLVDHYRRQAARTRAEASYRREPHVAVLDPEDDRVHLICLCMYRAIPALKPEYADVLNRADLNEEPREQIAADLGLTVNNVGVRLHRARHALRTKLEEICGSSSADGGCKRQCSCGGSPGPGHPVPPDQPGSPERPAQR